MDNLKTLMDKRQYELVIKLTNNAVEPTDLFYRISALLASGKGEEALSCIKANQKLLESNLFVLIKVHIEILCLLGKFDEAGDTLRYYEELPYESQQVEEALRDMPDYIRAEERKAYYTRPMDDDKLLKELRSNNPEDVLMALDIVKERDILKYLAPLQEVMLKTEKQSVKAFALMVLVDKEVNREMKFDHLGEILTVNPSKLEKPFASDFFNHLARKIGLEIKNTVLGQNAIQMMSSYVIYQYPKPIEYPEDEFLWALYHVGNKYLQMKDAEPLEEIASEHQLNLDVLKEIVKQIEDCLENF